MKIDSRNQFPQILEFHNLPRVIAEVGTAEGIFSQQIFGWGVDKLYLIDIWENVPFISGCGSFPQEWHDKNYERVKLLFGDKENVVLLKGFSHKMANEIPDESLGMAYIDANHTYEGAKSDAEAYWSKLVPGGIMGFHDYGNAEYGVGRAVKEFAADKNVPISVLIEDGDVANIGCWIRK